MHKLVTFGSIPRYLSMLAVAGLVSACGGGGGGDDGLPAASVAGTVASGAALTSAAVMLTCGNGAILTGTTSATGTYTSNAVGFTYPCIGSATKAPITYRGILFAGGVANFTPLTDLLVEAVLAASSTGTSSLTIAQFLSKIQTDSEFARSVSAPTATAGYRTAVLTVIKAQLVASGKTAAEADLILASAGSFESTTFAADGTGLDKVLDDTASVLQNANGTVRAAVITATKAEGDKLPLPTNNGTGGTGGTGGSGGTGG